MSELRNSQFDLFDMPIPAPPPAPIESVHWLVVTTKRARTACGIEVAAYHIKERVADPAEGERIRCTHDFYDRTVTCPRCKEAI